MTQQINLVFRHLMDVLCRKNLIKRQKSMQDLANKDCRGKSSEQEHGGRGGLNSQ